ncbi:virulence protein RhuM/Fic/DOC family protein [Agromyces larvae]|uniref:Virulence RhuM family protein n=1 Tax=Agromyces larvae TaxID=2929802 RepID=A0ABY4C6G1_9MICO|nr:virulence protein RhuM/Fic/DOC family protein [Agromyces larvae]UOE45671.1 virulence RhuM family protein [Agromyces larvae]
MPDVESVELYRSATGEFELAVRTDGESVWLTAEQLVQLFGRDKSTISRHLRNVFSEGELEREAVVADFATTATDGKTYRVAHYDLDVVISVGYRVKSPEGVRFRRWATQVLRRYLLEGVALNERRLEQLGSLVRVLSRSTDELVAGVAEVVARYLPSLRALRAYDEGEILPAAGIEPFWTLTYGEARAVIDEVGAEFPDDTLFGGERGDALRGVVETIYQGFGGVELYSTVQEKAANLLYLVVKDHPLSDGNKRSAAALFVHFLARNGALDDAHGVPLISNNALAAITLMVAMSDPKEKELIVGLLVSMLAGEAP